jgi:large subunit ribosomal protein L21
MRVSSRINLPLPAADVQESMNQDTIGGDLQRGLCRGAQALAARPRGTLNREAEPATPEDSSIPLAIPHPSCYISSSRIGIPERERTMYVVFEDGSRQYLVSEQDVVTLDYRPGDPGTQVMLDRVLLYQNGDETQIGQPTVSGLRVVGEVVEQTSEKYIIGKFRRRKNYRRKKGHRQPYTEVKITKVLMPGEEPPAPKPPEPTPAPQSTEPAASANTPATPPA